MPEPLIPTDARNDLATARRAMGEYVATKQAEALREYRDALAENESAENWSERSDYLHDIDDWIAS